MTGLASLDRVETGVAPQSRADVQAWLGTGLLALAGFGLFGRLMAYPLRHDEQMYLPVGALLREGALYQDFGFNNLPNLPVLLALVFGVTGTDHYLLTGRLIVFAGWIVAALALGWAVHRATRSVPATLLAVFVLMSNPVLLAQPGMLVTNNFLPLPFALLGTALFIAGIDRPAPSFGMLLACGASLAFAAGFKANFIFLAPPFAAAALLVRRDLPLGDRLRRVVFPLFIGGIAAAAPVLFYLLQDPAGFFAHTLRYHQGPHIAYWTANPDLDGEKIMGLGGKLQLSSSIWFEGVTLLVVMTVLVLAFTMRRAAVLSWPALLTAGLAVAAALVAFLPTPAFPQYYVAPIPFAILTAALLYGRLDAFHRHALRPVMQAVAVVAVLLGVPRLAAGAASAVDPARWTGYRIHAAGQQIADLAGSRGTLATLSPIYALEGGMKVYTELATGPLVYRVGELIPAADRRYYRMVSPRTVGDLLKASPPVAVLTGFEGDLDTPLVAYARQSGMTPIPLPALKDRYGTALLFVRKTPHG